MNDDPKYGDTRRFPGATLESVRAKITEALKAEGFGILTEIDVQATFQKKLGKTVPPFVILGACNPVLADQALTFDPGIALLLPCNVTLREEAGAIVLSMAKPESMFSIVGRPEVESIACEAGERLRRALAAV